MFNLLRRGAIENTWQREKAAGVNSSGLRQYRGSPQWTIFATFFEARGYHEDYLSHCVNSQHTCIEVCSLSFSSTAGVGSVVVSWKCFRGFCRVI
jgi:hypothetical protein